MPKAKVPVKAGSKTMRNARLKFKLGNRKSTTSALHLSNEELLKKAENAEGRDKNVINNVMGRRGLTLDTESDSTETI